MLKEGVLGLFDGIYQYGGGSHWHCVENKYMWLGFYNVVSGTYLGHNNNGQFIATTKSHVEKECFCARQHPGGSFLLLVKNHPGGFLLMKVGGKDDRELVADEGKTETAWEFIRVDSGP